jgi:hypothetical protein
VVTVVLVTTTVTDVSTFYATAELTVVTHRRHLRSDQYPCLTEHSGHRV